jgi:hypothetical protein
MNEIEEEEVRKRSGAGADIEIRKLKKKQRQSVVYAVIVRDAGLRLMRFRDQVFS